jgi:hypothetical protein
LHEVLRVCLAGLRLRQTHSVAAAPPVCSSTVELDSPFRAEGTCLTEIMTSAPKIESLNRLPFFSHVRWCVVRVLCSVVRAGVLCVGVHGVRAVRGCGCAVRVRVALHCRQTNILACLINSDS